MNNEECSMAVKPKTFEAYLAQFDSGTRAALEKLRGDIHTAAPETEEYIAYGLPAFRFEGKPLVAIGATSKHCALYLMSTSVMESFQEELADYDTGKGTIRFSKDHPMPQTIVRSLVTARIVENAAIRESAAKARESVNHPKNSAQTKKI
jgi:uncharacterized protein YdhG (YjbR/CyaY superfamily)